MNMYGPLSFQNAQQMMPALGQHFGGVPQLGSAAGGQYMGGAIPAQRLPFPTPFQQPNGGFSQQMPSRGMMEAQMGQANARPFPGSAMAGFGGGYPHGGNFQPNMGGGGGAGISWLGSPFYAGGGFRGPPQIAGNFGPPQVTNLMGPAPGMPNVMPFAQRGGFGGGGYR